MRKHQACGEDEHRQSFTKGTIYCMLCSSWLGVGKTGRGRRHGSLPFHRLSNELDSRWGATWQQPLSSSKDKDWNPCQLLCELCMGDSYLPMIPVLTCHLFNKLITTESAKQWLRKPFLMIHRTSGAFVNLGQCIALRAHYKLITIAA